MTITVTGSQSNDGDYTIDTVANTTLTLVDTDTLTAEESSGTQVTIESSITLTDSTIVSQNTYGKIEVRDGGRLDRDDVAEVYVSTVLRAVGAAT